MIRIIAHLAGGATAFLIAAAASAQSGPPTGPGVPGTSNPYARPEEMGAHDNMSATDVIRRGVEQAQGDHDAAVARSGGRAVPAKPADIVEQAAVSDSRGELVGTIESIEADGAVVATAAGRVKIPLQAFGKNKRGLLLGITKREFDALVTKANAQPVG